MSIKATIAKLHAKLHACEDQNWNKNKGSKGHL